MIKVTFKTEADYLKFIHTALIFTSLRAYNGGCYLWKKEDIEHVKNVDDIKLRKENHSKWKESYEVYKKAENAYGADTDYWKGIFEDYEGHVLLRSFGLEKSYDENEDGSSYCAEELDYDLNKLEKTKKYPKSFPVITLLENGSEHRGPSIEHVYPDDFNKNLNQIGDFSWLEENVRAFWMKGEGYVW